IPRKVASENNIRDILIDTYPGHVAAIEYATLHNVQYEVASKDPVQKAEIANYGYMPVHYGVDYIHKLFSAYSRPLEIGAYYYLHDTDDGNYPTQEGYVMFKKVNCLSHPHLPSQIVVGRELPISTKIADFTSPSNPRTKLTPKNKDADRTPPAKNVQQQSDDGFKEVLRKRTAKKRRKARKAQESRETVAIFASIGSVDTADKVLFEVCIIYAHSGDPGPRNTFFTELLQQPFFRTPGQDVIVLGDFSYRYQMRNSAPALRHLKWQQGAPIRNQEKISKLEELWHKTERRLDKLLEASMNA
ncbi:hypothetical protein BG015_004144, partial [Linnemannia schmuckeri]